MEIKSIYDPFPHLIVENVYSDDELVLIWKELEFLNQPGKWKCPTDTGTATEENIPLKNNLGLFLDGDRGIYKERQVSNILTLNRKIVNQEIMNAYSDLSFGYKTFLQTNADVTLLSYYENGHNYKKHIDDAVVSSLTWFYKEPKMFSGGDLVFSDFDRYRVEIKNNRAIIFPSFIFHEVEKVSMPEYKPQCGRYCVTQFFLLQ